MIILETQVNLNLCYTVFKQNLCYLVISKNTLVLVALYAESKYNHVHTSFYIIVIVFKCVFLLNEVWRLAILSRFYEGYLFSSYSIFIKSIMIIVIIKRFFSAKINTFFATRMLKKFLYSDSNLECRVYLSGFQNFA